MLAEMESPALAARGVPATDLAGASIDRKNTPSPILSQDALWVLARARSMSLGVRLIQAEIDEIGISLKNGWITAEQAARDLAALEQLPCYVAATFLSEAVHG